MSVEAEQQLWGESASKSWKDAKEAFVTGHAGTHPAELFLVCSCLPIGVACYGCMVQHWKWSKVWSELMTVWWPVVLCQTTFQYPYGVAYLIGELALVAYAEYLPSTRHNFVTQDSSGPQHLLYFTAFRSSILLLTFCAILAVDFSVFPRRFVKTETHGTSLMDMGAAALVVAAGLVSPRARKTVPQHCTAKKMLFRLGPLIFMGSLRFVTHQELDYQEHVSEYGVHWNFFYTLAVLHVIGIVVPGPTLVIPVTVLECYQLALSAFGLQAWVQDAPRQCTGNCSIAWDFVMANREGLLGCVGYGALYLLSEWIASQAIWTTSGNAHVNAGLAAVATISGVLWQVSENLLKIPVSRRTINLSFCLWILFSTTTCLMLPLKFVTDRYGCVPPILSMVNQHGLLCFIIANLLTGAVNLSINTLKVGDGVALIALTLYMAANAAVAVALAALLPKLRVQQKSGTKHE